MEFKERIKKLNERKFTCADIINCLIWMTICCIPLITDFTKPIDPFCGAKFEFLIVMGTIILVLMGIDRQVKLNKANKLYLVFFGIAVVSTIFAFDTYQAIRGYWEWWEGLIAFFMYGVMFIAASSYLKINKYILNIFIAFGLLIAIIVIAQGFDISLFGKTPFVSLQEIRATIGNRNFVSSYLIIFLGITMSSFILKGKKKYLVSTIIFYIALVITITRGGWVTLALIYLILIMLIYKEKLQMKRAIAIAMIFVGIFFFLDFIKEGKFTNRLETIKEDVTNFSGQSGSGRIAIYKAVGMVIKEHPILGMGPDNLWFGIDIYVPEREEFFWQEQNLALSKAHNEILHITATLGIPAAIVYLSILWVVLKKIWGNIKDDKFKVIFITIIGYIIQANLNISVIDVACVFWVILGVGSNPEIIKKLKIEEA